MLDLHRYCINTNVASNAYANTAMPALNSDELGKPSFIQESTL